MELGEKGVYPSYTLKGPADSRPVFLQLHPDLGRIGSGLLSVRPVSIPEDVSEKVSRQLSATFQHIVTTAQDDLAVTLLTAQVMIKGGLLGKLRAARLVDPDEHDLVAQELDALVETFGDIAVDNLIRYRASETLSSVIENCTDHDSAPGP